MRLIGMLDSPYVRRVAVSLQLLGLRFEHEPWSVFRTFKEFSRINPVVKAPTLVCDGGEVLMDSTLILQYAESLPYKRRSLMPTDPAEHLATLRCTGLALAACEKAVSMLYETQLRPTEQCHAPWVARVAGQLQAAFSELEAELQRAPLACTSATLTQAGISTAVAWHFTQRLFPDLADAASFPALQAFSLRAEALPEFSAAPHGDSTCRAGL